MKSRILLVTGSVLVALVFAPTFASAGGCPAFNSSMVDAAMLATEYSQPEPVEGEAMDMPSEPMIYCNFSNGDDGYFEVFVGFLEEHEPPTNAAHLLGRHPDGFLDDPSVYATQLRTLVLNLSEAEMRACRAQVLASFTWKQYCKPLTD